MAVIRGESATASSGSSTSTGKQSKRKGWRTGIVQRLCVQTTGETRIQRTLRPQKLVYRLTQL